MYLSYICSVNPIGALDLWKRVLTLLWATTLRAKVARYKEFMTKLSWLRDSSRKSSKPSYQSLLTSDHTIPAEKKKASRGNQPIALNRYSFTIKTLLTGFCEWYFSKAVEKSSKVTKGNARNYKHSSKPQKMFCLFKLTFQLRNKISNKARHKWKWVR